MRFNLFLKGFCYDVSVEDLSGAAYAGLPVGVPAAALPAQSVSGGYAAANAEAPAALGGDVLVRSGFSANVADIMVNVGDYVVGNQPLLTLLDGNTQRNVVSGSSGKVKQILVSKWAGVYENDVLVVLC